MKKLTTLLIAALTAVLLITCTKKDKNKDEEYERVCGEYHGKTLYTGPKGGCYYKQSDGDKTYVDRKYCKCLK